MRGAAHLEASACPPANSSIHVPASPPIGKGCAHVPHFARFHPRPSHRPRAATELWGCSAAAAAAKAICGPTAAALYYAQGGGALPGSSRGMSGLSKSGVPGPRVDVMEAHSTHHGGHLLRLVNSTETLSALGDLLHDERKRLTPMHVSAACIQLERLRRCACVRACACVCVRLWVCVYVCDCVCVCVLMLIDCYKATRKL